MRQRKLMNQINVVPYIDVMLVLLVIFMVTAPLVTPSAINLPSVGKSSQAPESPLEIVVKADGAMLAREPAKGAAPTERAIRATELAGYVRDRQRRAPDEPIVIAADKDVRYEAVMKVMDELQRQNVKRVGLLVKPEGK